MKDETIFYTPFGGSREIGMNMYAYGFKKNNKIKYIIVDAGVAFPKFQSEPGVDLIFANPSLVLKNIDDLEAIFITHAHEDHLGAIGFVSSKLKCKIYCRSFTASIVKDKLERVKIDQSRVVIVKEWPYEIKLKFATISFFPAIHSVPEASFLIIKTGIGNILHTGDFKLDKTPVLENPLDVKLLIQALEGPPALCVADSTNALNSDVGKSEKTIIEPIEKLMKDCKGRVVFTTFASNLARLKSIAKAGEKVGRSVVVLGRAMNNMLEKAFDNEILLDFPSRVDAKRAYQIPPENLLIIATGSQGEPRAVSSQLSKGKYMSLELQKGDTFVFSSKTIPGNEVAVNRVINNLTEKGIKVRYEEDRTFHVSGHTNVPDLKGFYKSLKPKLVIPMHGEPRHIYAHSELLNTQQIRNIIVKNGEIVEIDKDLHVKTKNIAEAERLFVDGTVIASSDNIAFSERRKIASEGILLVLLNITKKNKKICIEFDSIGLPRFDDYASELKNRAEVFLNNAGQTNNKIELQITEKIEQFIRKELYSFCGKKPLVKVLFLN